MNKNGLVKFIFSSDTVIPDIWLGYQRALKARRLQEAEEDDAPQLGIKEMEAELNSIFEVNIVINSDYDDDAVQILSH